MPINNRKSIDPTSQAVSDTWERLGQVFVDTKYQLEYGERKTDDARREELQNLRSELIRAKEHASDATSMETWLVHVVNAAMHAGRIEGLNASDYIYRDEGAFSLLAKNGAKGGAKKGINAAEIREAAAMALIAAAPGGNWPSVSDFDRCFYRLGDTIPNFSGTDYQRRLLMKRQDIKATLPPREARRRR